MFGSIFRPRTLLMLTLMAVVVASGVIYFLPRPPYVGIVDELPVSARLVRYEVIRHGMDYCLLFEFSCSDTSLRQMLVNKWQLSDRTESKESLSFVEHDHPGWWTPESPASTRRFGSQDDKREVYLSAWEQPGTLFVEFGTW
jgi:hypothetical protein